LDWLSIAMLLVVFKIYDLLFKIWILQIWLI